MDGTQVLSLSPTAMICELICKWGLTAKSSGGRQPRTQRQRLSYVRCLEVLALSKHLIAQYVQVLHEQLCVTSPLRVRGSAEYADAKLR